MGCFLNAIVRGLLCFKDSVCSTLKKSFTLQGRASRCEFWCFVLFDVLLLLIEAGLMRVSLGSRLCEVFLWLFVIVNLALLIPNVAVWLRRLHDMNLSGFWVWYLSPAGLGVIYMVHLLNMDDSVDRVICRITKVASPWLSWILAFFLWPMGAPLAALLLLLYPGRPEENDFGPAPCCKCCPAPEA